MADECLNHDSVMERYAALVEAFSLRIILDFGAGTQACR